MSTKDQQDITSNGTEMPEPISPELAKRPERKQSYWRIVWRQLKKNKIVAF